MVKLPNLGKNFFLFIQNWQCCPHLQHLGKYRYFTRSSSSEKDCSSSSNSEGTWGFPASLITPLFFCISILEEIRVRSSFVGISPGFQLPKGIEVSIKMCIYTWWTHQKQEGLFIMHGHINYHSAVGDFTASYIWTVRSMRFSPILLWRISFEFRCKSDRLKFLTSRSF